MLSTYTQLNEIEDAMSNLESTIMKLDAYSRSLETQVKKYEKTVAAARITSPTKD
jgi:exonuclease VII small subunit